MSTPQGAAPAPSSLGRRLNRAAQVLIVSSVMFTFISYWRTAAVVLCDLASTAYYIGGIVESAIGPAAPWFILAVMVFSYFVRMVYIESCTLFVRGGVYRVVRQALGSFLAKFAVSALMFDYILTGPISAVSASKYFLGLCLESLTRLAGVHIPPETRDQVMTWGAVLISVAITLYFFRQNVIGIHESSGKALNIMIVTTIMGVIILLWCALTLWLGHPHWDNLRQPPDLHKKVQYETVEAVNPDTGQPREVWKLGPDGQPVPKTDAEGRPVPQINEVTGQQEDPLGFLAWILPASAANALRDPARWGGFFGLVGLFGIAIAFGHSILAMSGEETLAQVYREVESPKLPNFKKAAFIIFVYSLLLTGGISFLAVLLIPNSERMKFFSENLISGLTLHLIGSVYLRLALNAFVVLVGFAILAGAVNTSIIGSNGVLNRVAEDGVLPDWFLKPHRRYGTTYRLLYLIVGLQLLTLFVTRGNVIVLGEAYAFGVIWSFVFQALSMVVLRFKDRRPREYKVPLNVKVGNVEVPIGLSLILLVLLLTAIMNFLTKEVATVAGCVFTGAFFTVFLISEVYHERRRRGERHQHVEQFNRQTTEEVTPQGLHLTKPYRKLVAIRSPQNLFMLEKSLNETDPDATDVVVMTAKYTPPGDPAANAPDLDVYDQQLMTAVVELAERIGKPVKPLVVPTNNPLHAVLRTAKDLQVNELVVGASNKHTADEQMEQMAFIWISLHHGQTAPLTVRILSRDRDMYLDLAGGNRIPKIGERRARSVAELRASGVGIDKVVLLHDGRPGSSDLFQGVLTMLDPQVGLTLVSLPPEALDGQSDYDPVLIHQDQERARNLGRHIEAHEARKEIGPDVVRLAREGQYDLIIVPLPGEHPDLAALADGWVDYILEHAHCRVLLASTPIIPHEVVDTTQSPTTP